MTTLTLPVARRPLAPRVKAQLVYVGQALTVSLGALAAQQPDDPHRCHAEAACRVLVRSRR